MASPPGAATVRVTAADAKEAVAKLEEELEVSRNNMRTLIPGTAPAASGDDDPLADKPTLVPTKAPTGATAAAPADASSSDRRTLVPTKKPTGPGSAPSHVSTDSFPVLEMAKTGRRSSVPPFDPAELDPDAEDSDLLPIAVDDDADDEDDSRPSLSRPSAIAPTLSSDPVATDALSVVKPMPLSAPRAPADGMRSGAIVAIAGLLALTLGGLSAWIMLGGDEDPSTPAPTAPGDATPTPTHAAVAGVGAGPAPASDAATPTDPTAGLVEIRAIAGARVEIDGEDRGEAPVSLELSVGEHRVRVAAPGHHPWQTTIDVKAGANAAVTAEPVPMDTVVVVPSTDPEPKSGGEAKPRPKSGGTGKPKPDAKVEQPKDEPKPKPKPDVFMDSNKGKDDGIFLPVGGK
jgi:hypothetical protein